MKNANIKIARYQELGEIIASLTAERKQIKTEVKANGGRVETNEFSVRIETHAREALETIAEFKRLKRYSALKDAGLIHAVKVERLLVRKKV